MADVFGIFEMLSWLSIKISLPDHMGSANGNNYSTIQLWKSHLDLEKVMSSTL